MKILVDSSVWIDYFRGGNDSDILNAFIDENVICINQLYSGRTHSRTQAEKTV
jgi:predicted nucleic acid-binding protein